jgi:hypothetical protein
LGAQRGGANDCSHVVAKVVLLFRRLALTSSAYL